MFKFGLALGTEKVRFKFGLTLEVEIYVYVWFSSRNRKG